MQWIGNRWEQVGIVSYAKRNCAIQGFPSVFTRLAFFYDWIQSYLGEEISSSTTHTTSMTIPGIYHCQGSVTSCGCGRRDVIFSSSSISQTADAIEDSWPMMVSLRLNGTADHSCGGTVLSSSFILTAAHCLRSLSALAPLGLTIAAGITNRFDPAQIIRTVDRIYLHPDYDLSSTDYRHDIALLHLDQPFDFGVQSRLTRSCLHRLDPSVPTNQHPKNGTRLAIIGWGVHQALQQAQIITIENSDASCVSTIGDVELQFCAGLHRVGSGGGIFRWTDEYWEQVGIVSYGGGSGKAGFIGVHTRLSYYYRWIEAVLRNYGHHPEPEIDSSTTLPSELATTTTQRPAQTTYPCQRLPDYCGCSANNVVVVVAHQPHLRYQEARPYSWSMIVSIRINGTEHSCGGTILSDSYILTSAQCVFDFRHSTQITVVAGVHTLSETVIVHRKVDQVHLHPDYADRWPFLHDIALLHLDHSLAIADTIARLAKTCVSDDFPHPASDMIVAGWYSPRSNSKTPDVLQQTVVRLLDNSHASCASALQNTRHQFCATLFASDPDSNLTSRCAGKFVLGGETNN